MPLINELNQEQLEECGLSVDNLSAERISELNLFQKSRLLSLLNLENLVTLVSTSANAPIYDTVAVNWLVPNVILADNPIKELAKMLSYAEAVGFINKTKFTDGMVIFAPAVKNLANVYHLGMDISIRRPLDASPYLPEPELNLELDAVRIQETLCKIELKKTIITQMIKSILQDKTGAVHPTNRAGVIEDNKIVLNVILGNGEIIVLTTVNFVQLSLQNYLDSLSDGLKIHLADIRASYPDASDSTPISRRTSYSFLISSHSSLSSFPSFSSMSSTVRNSISPTPPAGSSSPIVQVAPALDLLEQAPAEQVSKARRPYLNQLSIFIQRKLQFGTKEAHKTSQPKHKV